MKRIALIGVTGSIGRQVCSVVRRYPDKFKIESVVANAAKEEFLAVVREFSPSYAVLADERAGKAIENEIPSSVKFGYGENAALDAVAYGDIVFVAASGFAGLKYSLKAIELKKDIALANKETLVCGGELVMDKAKGAGVRLLPVDSEHSALWQALNFKKETPFKRLILTASGGPFYGYTKEQLEGVTPEMALRHPTWKMGAKITVDSATLLNKGFEVIEAKWLYHAELSQIHTLVQPESIVHSMVEFADGCVMAQMSVPSMELPIQLVLTYPERLNCGLNTLDFEKLGSLRFLPLERKKFPCFDLALTACEQGDNYPCALNGAGEVAVQAFLQKRIRFTQIAEIMQETLENTERLKVRSYEALKETDACARVCAESFVAARGI